MLNVVALLLSPCALAEPFHAIDVAWTTSYRARQDDLMSPLVHQGIAPFGGLFTYRGGGEHSSVLAGLEIDSVPAKSGPTYEIPTDDGTARTYPSSWLTARIPVGLGANVLRTEDLAIAVGGLFDARIEVLSWSYGVTYTTGYSGAFTLGPWGEARWQPADRWTFEGSLTLPLVGWLARSPYALNDDEYILANRTHNPLVAFGSYFADGGFTWLGDHQALRTRAAASFLLKGRTSLLAAYRFEVVHFTDPLPALGYGHALDLGVRVTF